MYKVITQNEHTPLPPPTCFPPPPPSPPRAAVRVSGSAEVTRSRDMFSGRSKQLIIIIIFNNLYFVLETWDITVHLITYIVIQLHKNNNS